MLKDDMSWGNAFITLIQVTSLYSHEIILDLF